MDSRKSQFDQKYERQDSAIALTDLELNSFKNAGSAAFPPREETSAWFTPHKVALNTVRVFQVVSLGMMAWCWRLLQRIGVDLADVAQTKDYIGLLTLTSEKICKITSEPINVSDLDTEGLFYFLVLS